MRIELSDIEAQKKAETSGSGEGTTEKNVPPVKKAETNSIREEIRLENAKMKDRPFREKMAYYADYYKWYVVAAVVTVLVATSIIKTVVLNKDYGINIVLLNTYETGPDEAGHAEAEAQLSEFLQLNPKKEIAVINSTMSFQPFMGDTYDIANTEKMTVLIANRELDLVAAESSVIEYYAQFEAISDLRTVFSEEELSELQANGWVYYTDASTFAYVDSDEYDPAVASTYTVDHFHPENITDPIPVALCLEGCDYLADLGYYAGFDEAYEDYQGSPQKTVIGIVANTEHPERSTAVLRYICGMDE